MGATKLIPKPSRSMKLIPKSNTLQDAIQVSTLKRKPPNLDEVAEDLSKASQDYFSTIVLTKMA